MDRLKEISEALESHGELKIRYSGGSQPGSERIITPLALEGDFLRARCHVTGKAKLFSLSKIQLSGSETPAPVYLRNPPPSKQFSTLEEIYNHYRDTLEGLGWHIKTEFTDDFACISLHSSFKNGKVKKGPDLSFAFRKYLEESYFDGEEWQSPAQPRESSRPFGVYGKFVTGGPWRKIEKALVVFMEAANANAPKS